VGSTVVLDRGVSWWFLNVGSSMVTENGGFYEHGCAVVVVVRQF